MALIVTAANIRTHLERSLAQALEVIRLSDLAHFRVAALGVDLDPQAVQLLLQRALTSLNLAGHFLEHARQLAQLIIPIGHAVQALGVKTALFDGGRRGSQSGNLTQVFDLLIVQAFDSQQRLYPRRELLAVEGLGYEIVGSRLSSGHAILTGVERSQQHDGDVPKILVVLESPADLETVDAGHHDV